MSNLIEGFGEIHHNHVCLSSIVPCRREIMRKLGELGLARRCNDVLKVLLISEMGL